MSQKSQFHYFFQREKSILLAGLIVGVILALIYTLFAYTPLFESSAKIYVRNIAKNSIITDFNTSSPVRSESGYSNPLFNYQEILLSEKLSSRVYKDLKQRFPKDLEILKVKSEAKFHDKFVKLVSAKIVPSTDVFEIRFKWHNEATANQVFDIVLTEYKNVNLEIQKNSEISNRKYLERQLKKVNEELDNIRTQIRNYRLSNRAIDIPNESLELTRARVELERQAQLLQSQVSSSRSKLKDLSAQLNMPNAQTALKAVGIGSDPLLVKLSQDLAMEQENYAKLQAKFKEGYPLLHQTKSQIESLKASIASRKKETLSSTTPTNGLYDPASISLVSDLARVQADSVSLSAQLQTLQQGISTLKGEENTLPSKKLGLDVLEKQEKTLALAYEQISQKYMEAELRENLVVDNIMVLTQPSEPTWAKTEFFIKVLALLMLATATGIAVAWVKYDIEDQWLNSEEIENVTNKKVLGVVPWTKQPSNPQDPPYVILPGSLMGIAYTNIANSLVSRSYVDNAHVISFLATIPARKDSPIVANLATAMAKLGKTTILIDTDFENPGRLLRTQLGANSGNATVEGNLVSARKNKKSLLDVISQIQTKMRMTQNISELEIRTILQEAIIPVTYHQADNSDRTITFSYLTAFEKTNNTHELVASPAFQAILAVLKKEYEFILLDSPSKPMVYPEMQLAATIADAVVLLSSIQANRQNLLAGIKQIEKLGVKLLGIVTRERDTELQRYWSTAKQTNSPFRKNAAMW